MVVGAIVLHHTTRLNSIIEQQLQRVSLQEGSAGVDAQRIVGTDPATILAEARKTLGGDVEPGSIPERWDGRAAQRIADVLERDLGGRA